MENNKLVCTNEGSSYNERIRSLTIMEDKVLDEETRCFAPYTYGILFESATGSMLIPNITTDKEALVEFAKVLARNDVSLTDVSEIVDDFLLR